MAAATLNPFRAFSLRAVNRMACAVCMAALAACGGPREEAAPARPAAQAAPASTPVAAPSPVPSGPRATTSADASSDGGRYTSLEATDCRVLRVNAETGDSTSACPGIGGYRLQVQDADARMSVDVVTPGGQRHPLALPQLMGSGFSSLGPRAEWRLSADGRTPQALIVRYLVQESPEAQRNISYLVVARLSGGDICAVGRIAPGPGQNEQARRIADAAEGRPCLESPVA